MEKTAQSREQTVTSKGVCTGRSGLTAEENVTPAHWVQIDDCSLKQFMISWILPFVQQSIKAAADDELKNLQWFYLEMINNFNNKNKTCICPSTFCPSDY